MPLFRKKPVVVEANRFDGTWGTAEGLILWMSLKGCSAYFEYADGTMTIPTLEGDHTASAGDWIIKGVKGEFYPCKPEIFQMTYEAAED